MFNLPNIYQLFDIKTNKTKLNFQFQKTFKICNFTVVKNIHNYDI